MYQSLYFDLQQLVTKINVDGFPSQGEVLWINSQVVLLFAGFSPTNYWFKRDTEVK